MCIGVLPTWISVPSIFGARKGVGCPQTGVAGGYEPWYGCWGLNLGPLNEQQQVHLTTELSLQPMLCLYYGCTWLATSSFCCLDLSTMTDLALELWVKWILYPLSYFSPGILTQQWKIKLRHWVSTVPFVGKAPQIYQNYPTKTIKRHTCRPWECILTRSGEKKICSSYAGSHANKT